MSPNQDHPYASAKTLAVVFGGPSPEHDVSILTGLQAAHELERAGREVAAVYWTKAGQWYLVDHGLEAAAFAEGLPRGSRELELVAGTGAGTGAGSGFVRSGGRMGRSKALGPLVVVNCCHGGPGEDGSLQGALDMAGVPYTGPSASGAALGMDKLAFGALVASAGLPTLARSSLVEDAISLGFDGPFIVKPRYGGSSIGIDVVADLQTAKARLATNPHLRQGAVIEPYREDLFDLNIGIRTWPTVELSAIERPLRRREGAEILGYQDKYVGGEGMAGAPRQLPAEISPSLAASLRDISLELAKLAVLRGAARVDFLSDGTDLFVNEVNTIPGSLGRYLWVDPPLSFIGLLDAIIEEALDSPAAHHFAVGADGSLLRNADSIASKLA